MLPLANLSGDPAQAYFSDGMTEEITTKLSQLRGLAVTAASSVARYRNAPADPRQISRGYRDVPGLRRSRWFAPLRDDPRFEPLLAKHGLGR